MELRLSEVHERNAQVGLRSVIRRNFLVIDMSCRVAPEGLT